MIEESGQHLQEIFMRSPAGGSWLVPALIIIAIPILAFAITLFVADCLFSSSKEARKPLRDNRHQSPAAAMLSGAGKSIQRGQPVMLAGLATNKELEGKTGIAEAYDGVMACWRVRLESGDLKSVRPENLRVLSMERLPSPPAPLPSALSTAPMSTGSLGSSLMGSSPPGTRDLAGRTPLPPRPPQQASGTSPLSAALIVQSSQGVLIRADGEATPHPEQHRVIQWCSLKGSQMILRARLEEAGPEDARIKIEAANGTPVALLDTKQAVYQAGVPPPPFNHRQAILHRVTGAAGADKVGPPCAWVTRLAPTQFKVQYMEGDGEVALMVTTSRDGKFVEKIEDVQGQVVVKMMFSEGGGQPGLWVAKGVDIILAVCVVLAVQKLG